MSSWYGCEVPPDLLYDLERDVWLRFEGDEVVLGMTDVAQTLCGRIVSVEWKSTGRRVRQGRALAVVESAKWVGPFPAPLSGEIVATNAAAFESDMAIANRDPYGAGWLVRLRPAAREEEGGHLVDGAAALEHYTRMIEERDIRCFRCTD